jgi:signal transduction histidine kinase
VIEVKKAILTKLSLIQTTSGMKLLFRNWIIGKKYIESWSEYRQAMLSGQYSLISLIVLAIYILLEVSSKNQETLITFSIAFVLILFSFILNRHRKHVLANFLLFHSLNTLIFLMGSSENIATGAFVYLIPLALGTFSVFHYKQKEIALCLCGFSILLFILALAGKGSLLTYRAYSDTNFHVNQLINFCIALLVSIIAVYLLISLSHHNAKKLERANLQLSKLNHELDRFVYSTSHDLRAPLLSVKGLLTLSETATPDEQVGYRQMMHKSLDSLDKFIKEITDYSRNNRLEILREHVNVSALATEIWESLQYNQDAQGIEFKNNIPSDLVVINDKRRMKVVLANLISNAIQYHDHRKNNQYIRLHHQTTASSFSMHVEDNGIGIAPELQGKVFEMFFRGTESSQGSGLGLYIVKETLSKLSGQISLQSVPKQGSTFSVVFPK